ncbi:MAG TPA: NAD(P)H-binding protein [Polyangiales bacterium]|nr:NAD(P)H-binding protein [Polyangiales bacterium]
MKRILIFGGTGRTGRLAIDYALSPEKKLEVVALVRSPKKLAARQGLTILQGTPESLSDVQRAIRGCDAVLSFLSPRSTDNPFTRDVAPNLLTMAATNAATAMKANDVRRIVILSAWGVGDSWRELPGVARWLIERSNLKTIYADHANEELVLDAAGLDWTSVRAVLLTGGGLTRTRLSEHGTPRPSSFISRQTVATFMIDSLLHREFFGKALVASRA